MNWHTMLTYPLWKTEDFRTTITWKHLQVLKITGRQCAKKICLMCSTKEIQSRVGCDFSLKYIYVFNWIVLLFIHSLFTWSFTAHQYSCLYNTYTIQICKWNRSIYFKYGKKSFRNFKLLIVSFPRLFIILTFS